MAHHLGFDRAWRWVLGLRQVKARIRVLPQYLFPTRSL